MYEEYLKMIDEHADEICAVSDAIWDYSELSFKEFKSSALLAAELEKNGFSVERAAGGIPTCFVGTYGQGKPVIGIQAEFDALDGLSQKAGLTHPEPRPETTTGHGCGHNLFAGGSFAAALAVKAFIDARGTGTVKFFGCPAEENGAGKVFMVKAGLYKNVDAVVSWHPVSFHMVRTRPSLANIMVDYSFKGIAAHAGGSADKGRSALDAAELMNVGCNFLREHMSQKFRIHYAFLDVDGEAPNVVQSHATVRYLIRATDNDAVSELRRRVDLLAQGAATMTETTWTSMVRSAYSNLITLETLQAVADEAMRDTPIPKPTEEEIAFGRALQQTMRLTEEQKAEPLYADCVRKPAPPVDHGGSTDTADVSWNCPTVQMHIGNWVNGTPGHSWQVVSQGKSSFAKKAELYAGKCVAGTVMRLFDRPETLAAIREEHFRKTKGVYICPLPDDVKPMFTEE